jgi:glycerol-3-phosphate acyltransferase PlsY
LSNWLWLPILVIAYLLGSIPFGLLIGKAKGVDVRKAGSGNIGASNVMRIVGTPWAVTVLVLDAAKAALPVYIMRWAGYDSAALQLAAGLCAVFGHTWSVYLRGKGGRGVASALGMFIALTPTVALIGFASWVLVVAVTRYISLASMLSGAVIVTSMFLLQMPTPYRWGAVALFVLVVYRHIPNIKRLLAGTEHRFGEKPTARP